MRVLAVDDSRTIRELVKMTLDEAGIDSHLAEDGQKALDALEIASPDIIVTDINMPVMDGFQLIEAVRNIPKYSSVPILVLTTESSADLKDRARTAGATGWIVKPFDGAKLIRALELVGG